MASAENSVKYQGATWRVVVNGKEVQVYALDANGDMKEDSLVVSTTDKLPVGPNAPWLDILKAVLKVGKSAEAAKKSTTEAERSAKRVKLIIELAAKGIKITPDGLVAKADIERALAEEELHMTSDEYNTVLKHIRSIFDGFDSLKTYLLGLLDKGSKEKDQELHKMIDEVVKQRSSLEGFYKHFNK